MIRVVYDGNLGNNLFQYAFGRILAEKLGYHLSASPIEGFPHTSDQVNGKIYTEQPIVLRGQRPDMSFLSTQDPKRQIILTGYFQDISYYHAHKDKIRTWFMCDFPMMEEVSPEDAVVGVRRGPDYIPRHGLPMSYYIEALSKITFSRLHITTDSPNDPFVKQLSKRYAASIRPAGALDNFQFFRRFKQMVISNSTFLWWAAYLSDADTIYFPRPANGFWCPNDPASKNILLEVPEDRYRYLNCARYRSTIPSEIAATIGRELVHKVKGILRPMIKETSKDSATSPWHFQEPEE